MKNKKYILIPKDLQKNLIEFLDEVQFDAAKSNTTEDMHIVNFCSWAIEELLRGFDAHFRDKPKNKPTPKSRQDYVDETFMDWNLPDMSDEEYNKLVDQVDAFLRGWEKEYNKNSKKNSKKKPKKEKPYKPRFEDMVQHCSLDEIKDMLIDDPELTDHERFELYYDEYERVNRKKEKTYTFKELFKGTGINLPKKK
mgnify:CR=1 FL=1|tara:strand:+ start:77 stop:664 length:588 start_codon:yes stop_codon:yes gene_type:complete